MNATMVMSDFVQAWLVYKKNTVKSSTFSRLVESCRAMMDYSIAGVKAGDVTFFDLQRYVNELVDNGYGISTIKKQLQIVTAPLKQAAALRLIPADPSVGVKLPNAANIKKKQRKIFAYTEEEQKRIRAVIDSEPDNVAYLCISMMMNTGMRCGEALALRWRDINVSARRINIHATVVNPIKSRMATVQESAKTASSNRAIPIWPHLVPILQRLKQLSTSEWVFDKNGERLTYQTLVYQTKKLCRQANVLYNGDHVFRHTFATNCYYKGVDIKTLSKILGHAAVQITYNTYINLYGDGFEDMYNALVF